MLPLRLESVLRIFGVSLILSLIMSFGVHTFDFSHVHPNELVPHEHQEYTPVFSVHAEEKDLWTLVAFLGLIAISFAPFFLIRFCLVLHRIVFALEVFRRKLSAPPPLALAFSRGRIHQLE